MSSSHPPSPFSVPSPSLSSPLLAGPPFLAFYGSLPSLNQLLSVKPKAKSSRNPSQNKTVPITITEAELEAELIHARSRPGRYKESVVRCATAVVEFYFDKHSVGLDAQACETSVCTHFLESSLFEKLAYVRAVALQPDHWQKKDLTLQEIAEVIVVACKQCAAAVASSSKSFLKAVPKFGKSDGGDQKIAAPGPSDAFVQPSQPLMVGEASSSSSSPMVWSSSSSSPSSSPAFSWLSSPALSSSLPSPHSLLPSSPGSFHLFHSSPTISAGSAPVLGNPPRKYGKRDRTSDIAQTRNNRQRRASLSKRRAPATLISHDVHQQQQTQQQQSTATREQFAQQQQSSVDVFSGIDFNAIQEWMLHVAAEDPTMLSSPSNSSISISSDGSEEASSLFFSDDHPWMAPASPPYSHNFEHGDSAFSAPDPSIFTFEGNEAEKAKEEDDDTRLFWLDEWN